MLEEELQILIHNGINPDAFQAALKEIMERFPGASLRGMQQRGQDMLATLGVPPDTDKGTVEQTWDGVYEARLEAAVSRALLDQERQHKQESLEAERQHKQEIIALTQQMGKVAETAVAKTFDLGNLLSHVTVIAGEGNTVAKDTQTITTSITTGDSSLVNTGDFTSTDSTTNLGTQTQADISQDLSDN